MGVTASGSHEADDCCGGLERRVRTGLGRRVRIAENIAEVIVEDISDRYSGC